MICPDYQETEKHPKVTVRVLIHKTMDRTDKTSLFKTVTQNTQYFFLPQPILHRSTLFFFFFISNYIEGLPNGNTSHSFICSLLERADSQFVLFSCRKTDVWWARVKEQLRPRRVAGRKARPFPPSPGQVLPAVWPVSPPTR